MQTENRKRIITLTRIAILGALASVIMLLEFPLPMIAPPFYELDFSEIPVLIGSFSMGPVAGIIIELLKILLKLLIKGTSTAFAGEIANFLVGCALVVPAGIIYKHYRTKSGALVAMLCGSMFMSIVAFFLNAYFLIPFFSNFYGIPVDVIIGMGHNIFPIVDSVEELAAYCVVPFNFIKGVSVSILTFIMYKHIHKLLNMIK